MPKPQAPDLPAVPLSPAQKRYLRSLGHGLEPVVMVGKLGLTDTVVAATAVALHTHELVKVRLQPQGPEDRHALAAALAEATESEVAQVLGRTLLLYKRRPKKPTIVLPKARPPAS